MKAFAIVAFLLFINVFTYGQESYISWNETKPLQWNDFSGQINDTSNFDAESFAEVKYSYAFNNPRDFHFDVEATFNRTTSWIKQQNKSDALLKHEQVHFDIAGLYAKKLQLIFDNYNYTSNFNEEIEKVFNQVKSEYHAMQNLYDEETKHSLNVAKQKEWETYIQQELERIKDDNTDSKKQLLFAKK